MKNQIYFTKANFFNFGLLSWSLCKCLPVVKIDFNFLTFGKLLTTSHMLPHKSFHMIFWSQPTRDWSHYNSVTITFTLHLPLHTSVNDLYADDSKCNFYFANKRRVHHEVYKKSWNQIQYQQHLFLNRTLISTNSFHLVFCNKWAFKKSSMPNIYVLGNYYTFTSQFSVKSPTINMHFFHITHKFFHQHL